MVQSGNAAIIRAHDWVSQERPREEIKPRPKLEKKKTKNHEIRWTTCLVSSQVFLEASLGRVVSLHGTLGR